MLSAALLVVLSGAGVAKNLRGAIFLARERTHRFAAIRRCAQDDRKRLWLNKKLLAWRAPLQIAAGPLRLGFFDVEFFQAILQRAITHPKHLGSLGDNPIGLVHRL